MKQWEYYQEEAAQFFRSLGMSAVTNQEVRGVRGVHSVDVLVTIERAWLKQIWIVECKSQQRKVTKLHVLALSSIINDVGADRGFLLSEVGFQSGTLRFAHNSNITLTGLEDLYGKAANDISALRIDTSRRRFVHLRERLDRANELGEEKAISPPDEERPFWGRSKSNVQLLGRLLVVELAISDAELNKWPVLVGIADVDGLSVSNRNELAQSLEFELDDVEIQIKELESQSDAE